MTVRTPVRSVLAALVLAALLRSAPAFAGPYLVFQDDRAGFNAALQEGPLTTVVDSSGAFAPNPAAAAGVASLSRTGTTSGQTFSYSVYDVNYSNTPTGRVTPGAAGGDVSSGSTLNVELPAVASGATGTGSFGIDNAGGDPGTRNAVLVDFTTTPGGLGIGHFGLDLIDFEATPGFVRGELRLYDAGFLVFSHLFDWGAATGNGEVHFLGVVAVSGQCARFDQAMVVIGDDNGTGTGEGYGADRFTFGQAIANPEPGTWALFGLGTAGLAAIVRRRRRAHARRGAADGVAR
jgi:hypothetical protein